MLKILEVFLMKTILSRLFLCFALYWIIALSPIVSAADNPSANSPDNSQIIEWTKVINAHPDIAVPYLKRGAVYNSLKQYDLAINDFNRAIEINPKYAIAYNSRAYSYDRKQQYDLALKDLSKSIEIDPSNARTYAFRAGIYNRNKQYDLAITDCNKSLELDSKVLLAYMAKASALESKIMYPEAIEVYNKLIANAPPSDKEMIEYAKNKIRSLGGTL